MRRAPVQGNLSDQPAFYQSVQAIINRRHRDIRHARFGPDKNLLGCGMIAFIQQDRIHMLALWGKTKTAARQPIIQFCFLVSRCPHDMLTLSRGSSYVNTWNNSN